MLGPFYVNNQARRIAAWGQPCQIAWGEVMLAGKKYKVHRDTVPCWEVFEMVRAKHGYMPTGTDTGFYNCRHMRHNPALPWSSHAWATALDLNWLQNPAGSKLVTDMPQKMIDELKSIKTNSGAYVWMWGGDWDRNPATGHSYYDAMHWEVVSHPIDIRTGIAYDGAKPPIQGDDDVVMKQGDRSNTVKALQKHLNDWRPAFKLVEDGIFGAATTSAVADYQRAAELDDHGATLGVCDSMTFGLLATNAFRNRETLANIIEGG